MRTAASVKSLMQIKDVTKEDAEAIRRIWHGQSPDFISTIGQRGRIDAILRTYGVEYLGLHKRLGYNVYYCNAGDNYSTTVLFVGPHLRVGCLGDLVEHGAVTD